MIDDCGYLLLEVALIVDLFAMIALLTRNVAAAKLPTCCLPSSLLGYLVIIA